MITIDEAILNEKERTEKNRNLADSLKNDDIKKQCLEQANEHQQIAEWLEDYKKLKHETEQDIYERAYKHCACEWFEKIAEQLKEGGTDE